MRKRGFTLVEIMIVVAIIALLAAIAIPNLLQARRTANDAAAQANIRTLSTAAETFSAANTNGLYPASVAELTGYAASTGQFCTDAAGGVTLLQGYNYACTLAAAGYTITARAATCGTTGSRSLSITTGGVLTSAACS
jgi:type IV pilus assembly protein PilA